MFLANQAIRYATKPPGMQASINWEGCARKGIQRKNGGDGRDGAPISLDGVAVHPDCWCVCLCYLHFAPENPEEGEMYLLVPAQTGCPRQSPGSCKMVVCVLANLLSTIFFNQLILEFFYDTVIMSHLDQ